MPFRARKGYYGVDRTQEHSREEVIRDIRPVSSRFFGALLGQDGYAAAVCAAMGLMAFEPASAFLVLPLLALLCLCRRAAVSRDILPMRVPQSWKGKDYGDMTPQGSCRRARGMFYIGNDLEANRELWISRDDILTHMLILGTTGSGKTETLVSLAFNYLAVGGGLLYVDPKAAPKLAVQLYTMCRIMGRDDDFLLLSYMVSRAGGPSGKSGLTRTPRHESNTQNPFAVGGANQLTQLLFSLMPGDDDSSGNAIFSSNAQTLISGLMFVLVEMRDRGEIPLSIDVIRRYLMDTEAITKLALRTDLPEKAVLALQAGLATVGWDKNLPLDRQPRAFGDQYGYARAYFGRALSLLVDNYGRIFMTTHGEVDAVDVITGRRIYVTLIPSMDKDPKELRSLGQICLSSVQREHFCVNSITYKKFRTKIWCRGSAAQPRGKPRGVFILFVRVKHCLHGRSPARGNLVNGHASGLDHSVVDLSHFSPPVWQSAVPAQPHRRQGQGRPRPILLCRRQKSHPVQPQRPQGRALWPILLLPLCAVFLPRPFLRRSAPGASAMRRQEAAPVPSSPWARCWT